MSIKRGGNEWIDADAPAGTADDLAEVIQEIRRLQPAAVVVDAPAATTEYLADDPRRRARGRVDRPPGARSAFPSHLVVNPLLGPGRESYEFDRGTQLLLGAALRPGPPGDPPHAADAGAGAAAAVPRRCVALRRRPEQPVRRDWPSCCSNAPKVGRVDVVVRPCHPHLEELKALAATAPERLEIVREPAEVAARIARCHFAVTAGNGWSLELACVGVPQLIIVQNEVHWPTAQRLEEEGAATCLGWHENVSAHDDPAGGAEPARRPAGAAGDGALRPAS